MNRHPEFRKDELTIVFELLETLNASLDVNAALRCAYPLLCKLVPADYGALCTTRPESLAQYDWAVAEIPQAFFHGYADIAPHDFVRAAVALRPNTALSDIDMMPDRVQFERHRLYQHCLSHDVRIERVLAVMFSADPTWHAGLTLYRAFNLPFSVREQQILQFLAPYFSNAITNCKRYSDNLQWTSLLEASLMHHGTAMLVFTSSLKEVARSDTSSGVIDRCFHGERRVDGGLPEMLEQYVQGLALRGVPPEPPGPWVVPILGAGLIVRSIPVVKESGTLWLVHLDEIPLDWRVRLTPSEIDVAVRVMQGWDNELVAKELGNSVLTVKTHLYRVFNKLGVSTRTALTARFMTRE